MNNLLFKENELALILESPSGEISEITGKGRKLTITSNSKEKGIWKLRLNPLKMSPQEKCNWRLRLTWKCDYYINDGYHPYYDIISLKIKKVGGLI